jgi:hypothetical protein
LALEIRQVRACPSASRRRLSPAKSLSRVGESHRTLCFDTDSAQPRNHADLLNNASDCQQEVGGLTINIH